jgi:hypothetical protein
VRVVSWRWSGWLNPRKNWAKILEEDFKKQRRESDTNRVWLRVGLFDECMNTDECVISNAAAALT